MSFPTKSLCILRVSLLTQHARYWPSCPASVDRPALSLIASPLNAPRPPLSLTWSLPPPPAFLQVTTPSSLHSAQKPKLPPVSVQNKVQIPAAWNGKTPRPTFVLTCSAPCGQDQPHGLFRCTSEVT